MELSDYKEEDFISDESFQDWVFKRDEKSILFWELWILKNPEKRSMVESAEKLLTALRFTEKKVTNYKIENSWEKVDDRIERSEIYEPFTSQNADTFKLKNWSKMAAVFIVIVTAIIGFRIIFNQKIEVEQTSYGQQKTIILPDGSTVKLNGNSILKYYKDWENTGSRNVWIDGEGYFSVVHKKGNEKFIVHASNELRVEVLGTKFDVFTRERRTYVVLNSGKIKLQIHKPNHKDQEMMMKPGELVEYIKKTNRITKKMVNPKIYSSWHEKNLVFEETSIAEIIENLKNNYGYKVEVVDKEVLNIKVTGTIPNENIDILLESLSKTLNLRITKNLNTIIIKKNNNANY